MKKDKSTCDFSGYATVYGVNCTDGRTIMKDAFKHNDGQIVPLVWQHVHSDPTNILGHGLLENRQNGVYLYGWFNETDGGRAVKESVAHGDIDSISIYANKLVEKSKMVQHGQIREASLVLSGANPGAKIDYLAVAHADGSMTDADDEAIIYSESTIEHSELAHEDSAEDSETIQDIFDSLSEKQKKVAYAMIAQVLNIGDEEVAQSENDEDSLSHKGSGETVQDVFNTFSDKQKNVLYAIIGMAKEALDEPDTEVSQSDTNDDQQGESIMHNVFDKSATDESAKNSLTHTQFSEIMDYAQKAGSLKEAFIAHVQTYGIENIDYLFPDAKTVTNEPTFIQREMGWVSTIMNGTNHRPFSRIKSLAADITPDTARALGYVKGTLKKEEVFALLRRITTPTTIYKKQKLDRDDVLDITDVDVVAWLKSEMRLMLDEELARAILIGDGRAVESADKVDQTHIRPIYSDDEMYSHHIRVGSTDDTEDVIEAIIRSREFYKGSGSPTLFTTTSFLTDMLLVKDTTGRRIYMTQAELEGVLRVSKIVEVPVMTGVSRDVTTPSAATLDLVAILVNPRDYVVGTDKGGQLGMFDDFDINYNQMIYLIESRCSGALIQPKSAIVIEKVNAV